MSHGSSEHQDSDSVFQIFWTMIHEMHCNLTGMCAHTYLKQKLHETLLNLNTSFDIF